MHTNILKKELAALEVQYLNVEEYLFNLGQNRKGQVKQ